MAEPVEHGVAREKIRIAWLDNWLSGMLGYRFLLYFYDYILMRFSGSIRHRQLARDQLVCRFCGNSIDLLGVWKCECGFTRPGNYFGRCPKCLGHPVYIDCPACRSTMDVR